MERNQPLAPPCCRLLPAPSPLIRGGLAAPPLHRVKSCSPQKNGSTRKGGAIDHIARYFALRNLLQLCAGAVIRSVPPGRLDRQFFASLSMLGLILR